MPVNVETACVLLLELSYRAMAAVPLQHLIRKRNLEEVQYKC